MKGKLTLLLCMVLIASLVLGGCGGEKSPGDNGGNNTSQGKIAFVTGTGGLGDKSFNDLGYQGILKLMAEGIQVDVAEPTAISEMEGLIRNFAETEGYALIITMGGDSVDSAKAVSEDYPEQRILTIDGFANSENIKSVIINQEDTAFLVGAYAGLMIKKGNLPNLHGKNTIGVVGGMDIPLVRGVISGYMAGARYIDPDIKVLTAYVDAWNDPGKGSELAQALFSEGADIVFQAAGGSGLGVLEASEKVGYYSLGYDGNQNSLYPDSILASGSRGVDNIVYTTAKDALEGKFEGGNHAISMKDDFMAAKIITDESNIATPDEVLQDIERIKEFLAKGEVELPKEFDGVDEYIKKVGTYE